MSARWVSTFLLFAVLLAGTCFAQLTFTPVWGKRATGPIMTNSQGGSSDCRASADALMLIYRLIQTEAQKLLECSQK